MSCRANTGVLKIKTAVIPGVDRGHRGEDRCVLGEHAGDVRRTPQSSQSTPWLSLENTAVIKINTAVIVGDSRSSLERHRSDLGGTPW